MVYVHENESRETELRKINGKALNSQVSCPRFNPKGLLTDTNMSNHLWHAYVTKAPTVPHYLDRHTSLLTHVKKLLSLLK